MVDVVCCNDDEEGALAMVTLLVERVGVLNLLTVSRLASFGHCPFLASNFKDCNKPSLGVHYRLKQQSATIEQRQEKRYNTLEQS